MKNKLILSALVIPVAFGLFLSTTAFADSTAMTSPVVVITNDLSVGSTGSDVSALQAFLVNKGYLTIPSGESMGHYGALTQAAVMKYQSAEGIVADGIDGATTQMHIAQDSGATTTTTTSAAMTAPGTMTSAANLRVTLNNLLQEHVSSSLNVLRAISDGNQGALTGALAEQDANAVSLSAAIGSVYGTSAQTAFLTLFRNHITDSNNYTIAVKAGNMTNQTAALAALDQQLVGISNFLSGANPYIDNATLLAALRQHEMLVNQASVDYAKGDFADSYSTETQALAQIAGGGDYLANAIVEQYPSKFAN